MSLAFAPHSAAWLYRGIGGSAAQGRHKDLSKKRETQWAQKNPWVLSLNTTRSWTWGQLALRWKLCQCIQGTPRASHTSAHTSLGYISIVFSVWSGARPWICNKQTPGPISDTSCTFRLWDPSTRSLENCLSGDERSQIIEFTYQMTSNFYFTSIFEQYKCIHTFLIFNTWYREYNQDFLYFKNLIEGSD